MKTPFEKTKNSNPTAQQKRWAFEYNVYSHYDLDKVFHDQPQKVKDVIYAYRHKLCHEYYSVFERMFCALPDDLTDTNEEYRLRKDLFTSYIYDFFTAYLLVQYGAPLPHPEAVKGLWDAGLIPSNDGTLRLHSGSAGDVVATVED